MGSEEGPKALKDEAPTTSLSEKAYVLPSWFLEHNVKTSRDLATSPDQMVFCNCKDCEDTKLADGESEGVEQPGNKANGMNEKSEQGQVSREIHYKTFSELRDAICASFMPFRNNKLRQESTVVFRMQEESTSLLEPAWMSQAVERAVKTSKGISMITFDLETLEELGCEFHQQDKERAEEENPTTRAWEPTMGWFITFLNHYFATRSKANAGESAWQRNQDVLSTVLDAVKVKQTARHSKMEERDDADAVLIHIVDCDLVGQALQGRTKRRVLTRIAEKVQARRREGEAVAILLSTKCCKYKPGMAEFYKIGATTSSTVTTSRDKILDLDEQNEVRTGVINTQRTRRLMRYHLSSDIVCSDLLSFYSDWASADRAQTYKSFGERLWSSDDMEKVITLLVGRGWRISKDSSQMGFTDIRAVLERQSLFRKAESDCKSQVTEETEETSEFHTSSSSKFPNASNACNHTCR